MMCSSKANTAAHKRAYSAAPAIPRRLNAKPATDRDGLGHLATKHCGGRAAGHTPFTMRNDSGVGLLEVLIALTILAIGIIGTMQLFPSALRQVQLANERTVSSHMAAGNLGAIQSAGGDNLLIRRLEGSDRLRYVAEETAGAVTGARGMYEGYTSSVQRMRGASRVYLQRVTMNVRMQDGRYEQYVTYVARP